MPQYLISFDVGAMDFPAKDLPDVAAAAHAVVQDAMDAGVWVFGGGLLDPEHGSLVATTGTASGLEPESKRFVGGMSIVEVSSREDALAWGAKIAKACRCAQEVREFMPDPTVYRKAVSQPDAAEGEG
jgi:hypothetical protein